MLQGGGCVKRRLEGHGVVECVGRAARDGCVVLSMQGLDEVKTVRGLMEDPRYLWLQVDVGRGR